MVLEEARFLMAHTSLPVKVTLPSPYILARRLWHPDYSREAYPTRQDFLDAIIPVLRREALELETLGVYFIQLDDPWLSLFVDEGYRAISKRWSGRSTPASTASTGSFRVFAEPRRESTSAAPTTTAKPGFAETIPICCLT